MTEQSYTILGVASTASDEQVRAAYRRLAQIYHPDRFATVRQDIREEAERRMMELNAAFTEIFRTREPRNNSPVEMPSWWRASWDRELQQEGKWQEELTRRRQEAQEREAVHRRWEEIERIARQRTTAWSASDADGHPEPHTPTPATRLPAEGATTSDRIERLRRTVDRDRVREARAAAERLRRTIDLDSPQNRRAKAGERSKD